MFYYSCCNNIYLINSLTNEVKIVYTVKNNTSYSYEYIDNSRELLLYYEDKILIFDSKGEKIVDMRCDSKEDILSVAKVTDGYFILRNTNILYCKKTETIEYVIPEIYCDVLTFQNCARIFLYNKKLYYTHFIQENAIIRVKLVHLDIETGFLNENIIFESSYPVENNIIDILCINMLYFYGYIMFGISLNRSSHLFRYSLNENTLIREIVDKKIIGMEINNNNLLIRSNEKSYDKRFKLYNIKNFSFQDYVKIDEKPKNGYYYIHLENNRLFIFTYEYENEKELIIYERDISVKQIKLGALALKYFCKEKLDIEFGYHQDIKEKILNHMKSETLLEDDKVKECKIIDNNFYLISRKII